MFLRIGQPYTATLLVTDINGNRVLNDTPVVVIKNTQNNLYFNGVAWQSIRTELVMNHIANGVYSRSIVFGESAVYEATVSSTVYGVTKTEHVEVYDTNLVKYDWMINHPFLIKYTGMTASEIVEVKIIRDLDGMSWNGAVWTTTETIIGIPLLSDTIYAYSFIPDIESEYSITVTSGESEIFYIVNVTTSSDNIAPIYIESKTFLSTNGTDSVLKDEAGLPLSGVQLTVFDIDTKEIVAKTLSNSAGEWNMLIKPGPYYFMFEKDGYMSISFERTVM